MLRGDVHCFVVQGVVHKLGAVVGSGPVGGVVGQTEEVTQCEGERK